MAAALTPKQIATEVRKHLRAARGCRVPVSFLHNRLQTSHGVAMADLVGSFDLIQGLVRVRGSSASVMLG